MKEELTKLLEMIVTDWTDFSIKWDGKEWTIEGIFDGTRYGKRTRGTWGVYYILRKMAQKREYEIFKKSPEEYRKNKKRLEIE